MKPTPHFKTENNWTLPFTSDVSPRMIASTQTKPTP